MSFEREKWLDISTESERRYIYSDGAIYTIKEPTLLKVSVSGGHRITRADNVKVYVPPGWIAMEFEGEWVA